MQDFFRPELLGTTCAEIIALKLDHLISSVKMTGRFLGPYTAFWISVVGVGSVAQAAIELGVVLFLQLFLRSVGLLPAGMQAISCCGFLDNRPTWVLAIVLVLIGLTRSIGQFFVLQGSVHALEAVNFRLRLLLAYEMLLHPKQTFVAASRSQFLIGSIFPPASQFCYHMAMSLAFGVQLLALATLMFITSWREATVGILGLFCIGGFVLRVNRLVRRRAALIPGENNQVSQRIERIAHNWLLIRIRRTQQLEFDGVLGNIGAAFRHTVASSRMSNFASSGSPFLGILLIILLIQLSIDHFGTKGIVLLSFLYLFVRFVQIMSAASNSFGFVNQVYPQFKRALDYFFSFSRNERNEALAYEQFRNCDAGRKECAMPASVASQRREAPTITLQNITFSYDINIDPVLRDHSQVIPAGTQAAFVGPSGCGKSTLFLVILGLLKPNSGLVLLDGLAPQEYIDQPGVRISYAGAEPFVIAGTIAENLAYGAGELSQQEMWKALEAACLAEVVRSLPGGLSYVLSENREGLSAGQLQRLCLGRALAIRPNLLILDEATANLDPEIESQIVENLSAMKGSCTTLIISHRMASLRRADATYDFGSRAFIERQSVKIGTS